MDDNLDTSVMHEDEDEHAIERVARRFARATESRSAFHYVASKLRRDPCVRAIAALAPLGHVIDVGCGRGQLGLFLLERGLASRVHGIDWDEEKIALARRASEGLEGATFDASEALITEPDEHEHVQATSASAEVADTVLLVDVLHYMNVTKQDALLRAAVKLVRPGGRLVLREATTKLGWRSALTIGVEWTSKAVRLNLGERIAIRDVEGEIVPLLEALKMTCTVEPCWRGTPFANVLLVARSRDDSDLKSKSCASDLELDSCDSDPGLTAASRPSP